MFVHYVIGQYWKGNDGDHFESWRKYWHFCVLNQYYISILFFIYFFFNTYFFVGERSGQPGTLKDLKPFHKVSRLNMITFILLIGWLIIVSGFLFMWAILSNFFDQSSCETSKLNEHNWWFKFALGFYIMIG